MALAYAIVEELTLNDASSLPSSDVAYSNSQSYNGHRWQVKKIKFAERTGSRYQVVKIICDGEMVFSYNGGGSSDIGFLHAPGGEIYAVYIGLPWAGNGKVSQFFSLQSDGKIKKALEIEGRKGGPVFRDMDNDGKVEWIFDSREFYDEEQRDFGKNLLIYKSIGSGGIRLWKEIPNRNKIRLPRLMGEGFDGKPFGFRDES